MSRHSAQEIAINDKKKARSLMARNVVRWYFYQVERIKAADLVIPLLIPTRYGPPAEVSQHFPP
jgi:hypothetical protein